LLQNEHAASAILLKGKKQHWLFFIFF